MPTERRCAPEGATVGSGSVVPGGGHSSRAAAERALRAEGLEPHAWADVAGVVYDVHAHRHHKVLVCVSGGIVFHIAAGDLALGPGDRLELPAGVEHGATVGDAGVECVEAYRR